MVKHVERLVCLCLFLNLELLDQSLSSLLFLGFLALFFRLLRNLNAILH